MAPSGGIRRDVRFFFSHRHADRAVTARSRAKVEIRYDGSARVPVLGESSVHCAARKNATDNSGVPIKPSSGRQFCKRDRPYDRREHRTEPREGEKKYKRRHD